MPGYGCRGDARGISEGVYPCKDHLVLGEEQGSARCLDASLCASLGIRGAQPSLGRSTGAASSGLGHLHLPFSVFDPLSSGYSLVSALPLPGFSIVVLIADQMALSSFSTLLLSHPCRGSSLSTIDHLYD